jgi:hypothetical protein
MMEELLRINIPYTDIPLVRQLLIFMVLAGAWFLLRTRATELASVSALSKLVSGGQPVVLEFFRNT